MTRPGTYNYLKTPINRRALYERDKGICQICGKHVDFKRMTLDHKIPKSKGGTDADDNLQVAHQRCNNRKASHIHWGQSK